jgi:hypothetical protein
VCRGGWLYASSSAMIGFKAFAPAKDSGDATISADSRSSKTGSEQLF